MTEEDQNYEKWATLLSKLRETLIAYGQGISAKDARAALSRLEDELYRVSICQMDASRAMKDYTVDACGNVYENEKSDHLKRTWQEFSKTMSEKFGREEG